MRLLRLLSASVLALGLGFAPADAQSFRNSGGPAETPPASFTGNQYVDSRGCVFIRAGYGGRVTWVPRVTRDRKQVCGARSSTVAQAPARATPKAAPKQVVRRTVSAPKPAPQTTTRAVRQAAPAPQKSASQKVVRRSASAQPKVVYKCSTASGFSSQFVNKGARCGPQSGSSRTVVSEEISPQARNATRGQLAGPQGVNQRIVESRIRPPKGYEKVYKDGDRLNPLRGVGTSSGKAQMGLIWSNTVPRYLINPATGKRVN